MGDQDVKMSGQEGAGAGKSENQQIMDFAVLLKEEKKVLPNLSWDEVKALVRELKDPFGVVCEDELVEAEFDDQENKIKSIKGVQLKKFLKYVQGLKGQQDTQPPQQPKPQAKNLATLIKGNGGKATITGTGTVTLGAGGRSAAGREDGITNEAHLMVGDENVLEISDSVKTKIVAGETTDGERTMEFIVLLEKEVLQGLDHQMVVDLVHELQDRYGIHSASDLVTVNLEEMTLTSIKGEVLKKFRKYVQWVKRDDKLKSPQSTLNK